MTAFIKKYEPRYIVTIKSDINKMIMKKAGELKINKVNLVDSIFRSYFEKPY